MKDVLKTNCLSDERGCCGENHYSLNKIKRCGYKVIELTGGFLILEIGEVTIEFALLESVSQYDDEIDLGLIFHGSGTGGNLRECRHTYWNYQEDGYLFYMPLVLIEEAMAELSKHFD